MSQEFNFTKISIPKDSANKFFYYETLSKFIYQTLKTDNKIEENKFIDIFKQFEIESNEFQNIVSFLISKKIIKEKKWEFIKDKNLLKDDILSEFLQNDYFLSKIDKNTEFVKLDEIEKNQIDQDNISIEPKEKPSTEIIDSINNEKKPFVETDFTIPSKDDTYKIEGVLEEKKELNDSFVELGTFIENNLLEDEKENEIESYIYNKNLQKEPISDWNKQEDIKNIENNDFIKNLSQWNDENDSHFQPIDNFLEELASSKFEDENKNEWGEIQEEISTENDKSNIEKINISDENSKIEINEKIEINDEMGLIKEINLQKDISESMDNETKSDEMKFDFFNTEDLWDQKDLNEVELEQEKREWDDNTGNTFWFREEQDETEIDSDENQINEFDETEESLQDSSFEKEEDLSENENKDNNAEFNFNFNWNMEEEEKIDFNKVDNLEEEKKEIEIDKIEENSQENDENSREEENVYHFWNFEDEKTEELNEMNDYIKEIIDDNPIGESEKKDEQSFESFKEKLELENKENFRTSFEIETIEENEQDDKLQSQETNYNENSELEIDKDDKMETETELDMFLNKEDEEIFWEDKSFELENEQKIQKQENKALKGNSKKQTKENIQESLFADKKFLTNLLLWIWWIIWFFLLIVFVFI